MAIKTLPQYALELKRIAADKGHVLLWNASNPQRLKGSCQYCGLTCELIEDNTDKLTIMGDLKECPRRE